MRKIKFKVVKRRTNSSCMVHKNSSFGRSYEKGTNVYADPNTLGIMVFKTRMEAEVWMQGWNKCGWDFIIKRVIPIGRGKIPERISGNIASKDLKYFYENIENIADDNCFETNIPIDGTICYPGVHVID